MATRTAYYICKADAYKVFESDKTTVISTYAAHDIPSDDEEIETRLEELTTTWQTPSRLILEEPSI